MLLKQLAKSKNPIEMMKNSNPQAWNKTQEILKSGGSKEDMIKSACQQCNVEFTQVKETMKNLGINI